MHHTPIVAFQGALGAFSHEAINRYWNGHAAALPCDGFDGAIHAVMQGAALFVLLPIDNNTIGPIHAAREAIAAASRLELVGEIQHPVHHALMAPVGTRLDAIREVFSHPAALAQCTRFFAAHPQMVPMEAGDTAGAAALVAVSGGLHAAAIAPIGVAERFGLELLAHSIQDREDNTTTFAIFALASDAVPNHSRATA